MNITVPTLYKQYADLCEMGGVKFIDFNIDESFGRCIDGLVLVDLQQLKAKIKALNKVVMQFFFIMKRGLSISRCNS